MQIAEIYLEAENRQRNCSRGYRLTLSRDLFGAFMVEVAYGRIGTLGQKRTRSFAEESAARDFMATCLKRREGAPRRIGMPYTVRDCQDYEVAACARAMH